MKKCLIDGCDRDASSKSHGRNGYCSAHYQRMRIHGNALAYKKISKPFEFKKCLVSDCERSANRVNGGKCGYCSMHYQRFKRFGDPLEIRSVPSPAKDFIEQYKLYAEDDCLIWPFHRNKKDGYGRIHEAGTEKLLTHQGQCVLPLMENRQRIDMNQHTHAEKVMMAALIQNIFIGQRQRKTRVTELFTGHQTVERRNGTTSLWLIRCER
ncbi:hypothetical protein K2905_003121 [Escherichia coli]|nr:hypothetical protein [Escherichia coli]EHW5483632.1 hypothetical protein [Escherichia coli]